MLHVRAIVFMLHVRVFVFMLCTCACVYGVYVRLFLCCVRALVFMLCTCVCVHVGVMDLSTFMNTDTPMMRISGFRIIS